MGEETGFDVVIEQKGSLNLVVKTRGKLAHSALPERGVNAIERCVKFYGDTSNLQCFKGRAGYKNTIALTYLRGGQAINSIPDFCEMGINIRFVSKKDLRKILNFVKKQRGVNFSIGMYYSGEMMKSAGCEKEIKKLQVIAKGVGKTKTKKTATSSDAKFFTERGLPVIVFGPKGGEYHGRNEYVEIKSLVDYYKILYEFINK